MDRREENLGMIAIAAFCAFEAEIAHVEFDMIFSKTTSMIDVLRYTHYFQDQLCG